MTAAVSLTEFSFRHPAESVPALGDLTFSLTEGEFVLLAGPSGAGKSTLIRAIAGLAPTFDGGTAAGSIAVCGLDTREHGPADIARVCGTVLQEPERQVVMNTVRAELALPLESRGHSANEVARGVEEAALVLGIQGLLGRRLQNLSGGELQRVAIAAALAVRPKVLLLDEPASQLDPVAADELIWTLRRLNEEQGITILLSDQRIERILPAVDRVLTLGGGRLIGDASPREHLRLAADCGWPLPPVAKIHAEAKLVGEIPASVKDLRSRLTEAGVDGSALGKVFHAHHQQPEPRELSTRRRLPRIRRQENEHALTVRGLWDEREGGKTILAGVSLAVEAGEVVALMGRNGAGKTTLLRHAAGLESPTRGHVATGGRVVWLSQTPSAFLAGDSIAKSVPPEALAAAGLDHLADRNPRDLSGGETQRAALALVLAGEEEPAVVLLDEPTRGMDEASAAQLEARLQQLANAGAAILVATHDPELAARIASRTVLMGEGEVIADGTTRSVLSGGWHYSTETSRALGIPGGPITPEEGAALVSACLQAQREVSR